MGRPKFRAGIATSAPWVSLPGPIEHEYDVYGNHRITIKGAVGEWASYVEPAIFKHDDRSFVAFTDFWVSMPEIVEHQAIAPRSLVDCYKEDEDG